MTRVIYSPNFTRWLRLPFWPVFDMAIAQVADSVLQSRVRLTLAPMDGFSDAPFRQICRELGGALSWTPFLSATRLVRRDAASLKEMQFAAREPGMVAQLFGADPGEMLEAAWVALEMGACAIDINMGCSARHIVHRGSGAALLGRPALARQIIGRLAGALGVPVSAKIRLGLHDPHEFRAFVRMLADAGLASISVHGRTQAQRYAGKASWTAIGEIKQMLSIPVGGSGDVVSYSQAMELSEKTGVDFILIGRAAIGNPWIFSGISRQTAGKTELLRVLHRHLDLMETYYGPGGIVLFRKHLKGYLAAWQHHPLQKTALLCTSRSTLNDTLEEMLNLPDLALAG